MIFFRVIQEPCQKAGNCAKIVDRLLLELLGVIAKFPWNWFWDDLWNCGCFLFCLCVVTNQGIMQNWLLFKLTARFPSWLQWSAWKVIAGPNLDKLPGHTPFVLHLFASCKNFRTLAREICYRSSNRQNSSFLPSI